MTMSFPTGAAALALATLAATFAQCRDDSARRLPAAGQRATAGAVARMPPNDTLRLLVSGAMLGRLEPCGCASGQLGGLARRMQHIGEQRSYDLLLEGGDLVDGASELDLLKLLTASQILFGMARGYDALGVGPRDLQLPRAEWAAFLAGVPVVATNLRPPAGDDWPALAYVDREVRGIRARIGSLLLELPPGEAAAAAPLELTEPAAAWAAAMRDTDRAWRRIALVHGDDDRIRALVARLDPSPDLVVGVDPGHVEPTPTPAMIGDVPLLFAGIRGRVLLDVRLWREGDRPRLSCELVPLAGSRTLPRGGGDPQVHDALLLHRQQVKEEGVLQRMARLRPTASGAAYVGSATCRGCHASAHEAWNQSPHARAWQTLVDAERDPKRYGWPVTAYPDCVGCHVVGYGEQTGFVSFDDTPQLADVGCERCHGPASDHVAAGGRQRLGLIGGVAPSLLCVQCHDFEQSPDFVYSERWAKIQHGREPGQERAR